MGQMNHLAPLRGNPQGKAVELKQLRWRCANTALLVWPKAQTAASMNVDNDMVESLSQKDIFGLFNSYRGRHQREVLSVKKKNNVLK